MAILHGIVQDLKVGRGEGGGNERFERRDREDGGARSGFLQ